MTPAPVIANASPLIALAQINSLALLQQLFGSVLIPPAVAREITQSVTLPVWISQQSPARSISPSILATLDPGERETISLALEIGADWVVLDDLPARRQAAALGLPVIGTLGILILAKRRGRASTVRPSVDALRSMRFHMTPGLYEQVLAIAGEL